MNYSLDLASCSRERFIQVFDGLRKKHSVPYYTLHLTLAKMVFAFLKREELAEALEYPQMPDRSQNIMEKLLSRADRDKLIRQAPTLQDRLIFELLDETGGRKGELYKLRIRDIQFETIRGQLTAIVQLSGKSGTRRRRIYTSVPDLREQINNHPQRDNPNATILLKRNGEPFTIHAFYHRVHDLGRRILKRGIYPHQFRHVRATEDSRLYTDREMMMLFGWKNPSMVAVYSHLSLRDVDEKDLVLHGLKAREEILKPLMQVQTCEKCVLPGHVVAGDFKMIETCEPGNHSLGLESGNHVLRTFNHQHNGHIVRVKGVGTLPVDVTSDHPFLVVSRQYRGHSIRYRSFTSPYWKNAESLSPVQARKPCDYLLIPRISGDVSCTALDLSKYTTRIGRLTAEGKGFSMSLPLTTDLAWLLGIYVAEGVADNCLTFCFSHSETSLHARTKAIAEKLGYRARLVTRRTATIVCIGSRILARAFVDWCGKKAYLKQIPGFILYHTDVKFLEAFLEGYWAGDGTMSTRRCASGSYSRFAANTVSLTLALQMQLLLARLGHRGSVSHRRRKPEAMIEGRAIRQRPAYSITYETKPSKRAQIMVTSNYLMLPVRSVQRMKYRGSVYNLQTMDGTFTVNNILVHNCGGQNAPIALYCSDCGETLNQNESEHVKALRHEVSSLREAVERFARGEYKPASEG